MSKDPEAIGKLSGLTMGYTVQSGWSAMCVKGTEKDEKREVSWGQILRGPCTAGRKV